MKEEKNKESGITLISLVITIVVLLILAGISIATLQSDNGILVNTTKTKFMIEIKEIEEQLEIAKIKKNDGEDFQFGTLEELINRTDKYNEILSIENEKLVYDLEKVSKEQIKWLESIDINEKQNWIPIYTGEQLQKIASEEVVTIEQMGGAKYNFIKDGKYLVQNDINLEGSEENKWQTIENLTGMLDGQGYTITGLYINSTNKNGGMFATNEGTIKNFKLDNCNIFVGGYSGAICGINEGEINNISVNGRVENITTLSGTSNIGAICAENYGTILEGINYADIIGIQADVGGICSYNEGTIEKCINRGKISKGYRIGGICGTNKNKIKESINKGEIIPVENYGTQYGGICGRNYAQIENCYNTETVGSELVLSRNIAGIVGTNEIGASIRNCYNTSNIYGQTMGGITGGNKGDVTTCWYIRNDDYEINYGVDEGTTTNSGEKTSEELKEEDFLSVINTGNEENIFIKDERNINNGYPILSWQ